MPIYEFRCGCGHRFELLCRINDAGHHPCPACGGETKRVMSLFRKGSSPARGDTAYSSSAGGGCSGCASNSCSSCR